MKLLCFWIVFVTLSYGATPIPTLSFSDSINPGTLDYIRSGIERAEESNAPFILIEMDTPGGMLNSTRQIVQSMLNSKIPVVVYVSPKGAQAGSAGAIITFASNVAAMAPGTNLGAAHPVSGGGEKLEKEMNEKITNDTAAFAESLAKTHKRNTDWARRAVTHSASVIAEEALKLGVIDLIAGSTDELLNSLSGLPLKAPKGKITHLPSGPFEVQRIPMNIKHKVVSFFADPNIAYLIMSLGGLCIWIELSHPGLVVPGVIGVISVLLSLVSFQFLPISYGALAFILLGLGMLIAEAFLPTFGMVGVGGLISFLLGSLFLIDSDLPGIQLGLTWIFTVTGVLALAAGILAYLISRTRAIPKKAGINSLVGQFGETKEPVDPNHGKILIQGELWNAVSENPIEPGIVVRVLRVDKMTLVVERK